MIELVNVTKEYGDGTVAVEDVSFEVPRGETVTLVGPSGCGKTTTMTMVNRLTEVTEGEILVDGEPITEMDRIELRRNIGYVIQEIGLFEHMTVGENIAIVPDLRGWDEEEKEARVEELLELIQLPQSVKEDYPANLSGGQRQRVGVARAMAAKPDIILMDEPFGALDPITREELQDEFLDIQKQLDTTIMFVTHDIDEALKMGDRVAVLKDGKLIQYDTPEDLLGNPTDDFVASFIGTDRVLKQLAAVEVREVMNPPAGGQDVGDHPLSPDDSLKVALQRIFQQGEPLAVVENGEVVGQLREADIQGVTDRRTSEVRQ
ncbi:ABC transporter ATP-binding protein [Halobium palmae]|uniref:Molybdate/tungstate import ATP-binding protein WtpC n=1 Tax=Halobium palmae TaxID=1776492 RepID=A0ABD5RV52_9EURY